MHFGTKSWSKMVVSWRYADLSMEWSRHFCVTNAWSTYTTPGHYVAIDDLVITTPLKNDIAALWSCSGKAGASLLGQDVVASLLSLCMAKWLRKSVATRLTLRTFKHKKKRKVSIFIRDTARHTAYSLWFNEIWLYASLNHNEYDVFRSGVRILPNIWEESVRQYTRFIYFESHKHRAYTKWVYVDCRRKFKFMMFKLKWKLYFIALIEHCVQNATLMNDSYQNHHSQG